MTGKSPLTNEIQDQIVALVDKALLGGHQKAGRKVSAREIVAATLGAICSRDVPVTILPSGEIDMLRAGNVAKARLERDIESAKAEIIKYRKGLFEIYGSAAENRMVSIAAEALGIEEKE